MPGAGRAPTDVDDRRAPQPEARWRQVLEVAREAYVAVDAHDRVADWNRRAEVLFGWRADEAIGMPAAALLVGGSRGLERLTGEAADVRDPLDLDAVDRHGRVFQAQCTVWGVDRRHDTVVHVFVHDVTARRESERAAALLSAVVEGTSDAVLTRDLDRRILSWNAGAEHMLGWSAHYAVGRLDELIVPPDRAVTFAELSARVVADKRAGRLETEWLARSGARVPVSLTVAPVCDGDGVVVGTSAIARDVTEQRWLAATLDATLAALESSSEEARLAAELTRRFLADAAHQLRTPLAGIAACAETLLRGASPEDSERLLVLLVGEANRAARLLSSLLQMARLDQGQALTEAPADVVALVEQEVQRARSLPLSDARPLRIGVDLRSAPPTTLVLDAGAVREALGNLLDNARRHAVSRVTVVVEAIPDAVLLRVVDDGPGVPAGAREEVFERFVSRDGRGGSGLGLPIARALARRAGGDLQYDGDFVLTLPCPPC